MTAKEISFDERLKAREFCSLLYWYPRIQPLVPTPKTAIIPLPNNWWSWLDKGLPRKFITELTRQNKFGFPLFIRTDQIAAKHSWAYTCFVKNEGELARHVISLLEENAMVDMVGETQPVAIVIREFLKLRSFFTAYEEMPVAREFRFFASKGKINCYHPYWPHRSLEEGRPSTKDWRGFLGLMENDSDLPISMVKKASEPFDQEFSIDICQTANGDWFVTDMALGVASFHWKHGTIDGGEDR